MNATSFDSSDDEADLKRSAPDSPPEERVDKKPKNEESDTNNELDFEDTMSDTSATLMDTPYYNADECEYVPRYAICCLNCKCSEDKIMRTFDPNLGCKVLNNCGNSIVENGNQYLYHKACCHNFKIGCQKKYESPMQQAILNSHTCEQKLEEAKPLSDLQRMYNSERRKEVQRHNEDFRDVLNQWNWKIETYPDYMTVKEQYHQRIEKKELDHPLIVLDLFSGIGTTAVVLKKLKLPIAKMIHVEHDPVAVYVSKFNHKDDGIDHIYIESFEEIYGGEKDTMCTKLLWKLIDEHGPFDLVVAGAPCQNYSEVNAYRSRENYNASYLPKVGLLIRDMNDLQFKRKNREYPVLFMSENVLFKDSDNVSTYYRQHDEHGLPPIQLDGKDFSPMARNRFYWTNMPPTTATEKGETNKGTESDKTTSNVNPVHEDNMNIDVTNETEAYKTDLVTSTVATDLATPRLLLEDGWVMGVSVLATECEEGHMTWKANTSMASRTRIDDERMTKLKPTEDGGFLKSTYSVKEREIMMGLPQGYVSKAMKELFREIALNGFLRPESNLGKTYKSYLDRSLWHFVKKCNFKVKEKFGEEPFFQVMISAPAEGRKVLSHYDEEEYCKHLIGNGWSVPVVEHIFKGIREMYSTPALFQTYNGFDYEYPWPPYSDIVQTKKSSVDASASDDYINNHTETNSEYRNAAEADHPDPEDVNIEMNAENETNSQAGKQETTTVVNVTGFDTIILQKCTK